MTAGTFIQTNACRGTTKAFFAQLYMLFRCKTMIPYVGSIKQRWTSSCSGLLSVLLLVFLSLWHPEDSIFVHAACSIWAKARSRIEQKGCISYDWQMNSQAVCDEKCWPTQHVIVFLYVYLFLNSQDLRFSVSGALSCNRNEIRASAGEFSPDSLHITRLTLLSLWWYNPCAHRQTCAHFTAHWHTCMHTHPHANINLRTALSEWAQAAPLIFPPVACLEFSKQTMLDPALFCWGV